MAKEAPPPEPAGDVPAWFMTYSDVITLLMTFFILLLTFASNEPEQFERMQSSMFSGSGGTGIAGDRKDALERESLVVRTRPRAARLTMRGSEMPPIETDPPIKDTTQALAGLEEHEQRPVTPRNSIEVPLALLLEENGTKVSAVGATHLRMLARQLRRPGYEVTLTIHPKADPGPLYTIAEHLVQQHHIAPGQIGLATSADLKAGAGKVRIEVSREERGT